MNFPSFKISEYGLFDSRLALPGVAVTTERAVNCYEFELYTEDNSGRTYIGGKEVRTVKGTFLCAKPGQRRHSRLPFKCLYFHLTSSENTFISFLNSFPDVSHITDTEILERAFQELMAITPSEDMSQRLKFQAKVCDIISLISETLHISPDLLGRTSLHSEKLYETEKYIKENLAETLTLEALSRRVNLSPIYFHRVFSDFFGMTPNEFVTECRIESARKLLGYSDKSLSFIASECGFSSQSYFSTKFVKAEGITPSEYRKRMQTRLDI